MPRIKDGAVAQNEDRNGVDLDTAERARPVSLHSPMHEMRGAEADARNQPRTTSAAMEYKLPTNLDAPPPRPGMKQRWVRSELRSESDNLNWQQKSREGWRPRDPATIDGSQYYFGEKGRDGKDVIRVGGMILMEIPEQQLMAKRRFIEGQTQRQEKSVLMDVNKASAEGVAQGFAPITGEETTRVQTGRRPNTLAD